MKILREYMQQIGVYKAANRMHIGLHKIFVAESITNYYVTIHHVGWSFPIINDVRVKKSVADNVSEAITIAVQDSIDKVEFNTYQTPQLI